MRLTVGQLRTLIREAVKDDCWGGSHPNEMYNEQLIDDPSYKKKSVYVPDDIKRKIEPWLKAMGLSR